MWQSFLTSINAGENSHISDELLENDDTKEALEICQDLTEEERRAYDSFWDLESLYIDRENTVKEMGREQGRAEGEKLGIEKGEKQKALTIARNLKAAGLNIDFIAQNTCLTKEEILKL